MGISTPIYKREYSSETVMIQRLRTARTEGVPAEQWPKLWLDETSGQLRPVVQAYYDGKGLTTVSIALLRAYLVQWVDSPVWDLRPEQHTVASVVENDYRTELKRLRRSVRKLQTAAEIREWLIAAGELGIEPL